jgi:sec-independent protein translocase protein TatC
MSKEDIDASEAPLMDHLIELRTRLMWAVGGFMVAFIGSFFFSTQLFELLILPFKWGTGAETKLIGGMFIAFPMIATQIYKFVAPGLYKHERQALLPYLIATPVFFVLGAALVYFVLLPFAIQFFYSLPPAEVGIMPDVEAYLDFVMMLILAFGLTFQLPVVLTLLGHIGVVSYEMLSKGRRFAIVGVCAIAAVITPPDPISMLAMAVPLGLLYEIAVLAVWFLERRRKKADAGKELTP